MVVGEIIKARVTGIKDYGAFIKYKDYDGLIHISEFSDDYVKSINQIVNVGDIISCLVLEIDEFNKRLKLSFKRANMVDKKVLKYTKINIGFKSLEEKLDEWVENYNFGGNN